MEVKDACYTEDGKETDAHNVKSNVYANSTEWAEWKTKWESVRTNFCQIALTPGEDAAKLNAAWYSTTKDETPKIKLMDASGKEIRHMKVNSQLKLMLRLLRMETRHIHYIHVRLL